MASNNGSGGTQQPSGAPYRPYRLAHTLKDHSRAVSCVKFSNDGSLLASASLDKTLVVWDAKTLSLLSRLSGHSDGVSDLAWSSDSHYICSASDDRTLRIWDARSASGDCVKTLRGHSHFVFCVNFNPQSNLIVSGSFDRSLRIWDVKTGRTVRVIPDAHAEPITSVHFIRDGSIIVSASHDGSCKIWDADTGACLKTLIDDKTPSVSFAKFSPNGKFILVATLDDTLDRASGRMLFQGLSNNGLYPFPTSLFSDPRTPAALLGIKTSTEVWHRRLGHPASSTFQKLSSALLLNGKISHTF